MLCLREKKWGGCVCLRKPEERRTCFRPWGSWTALRQQPALPPSDHNDDHALLARSIPIRTAARHNEDSGVCGGDVCNDEVCCRAAGRGTGWNGPGQACARQVSTTWGTSSSCYERLYSSSCDADLGIILVYAGGSSRTSRTSRSPSWHCCLRWGSTYWTEWMWRVLPRNCSHIPGRAGGQLNNHHPTQACRRALS